MRTIVLALALSAPFALAQEHGGEATHKAEGEDHGGGHGDPLTMWKWANFAILVALAGYGISKAAGPFFQGRNEQIQHALVEAMKVRTEAEARASAIEARMANLSGEIEALRSEAHQEMAAESERVKAETARLVAKLEQHAQQEIESTVKHARKELRAYAAELALELAARKIEARMTPAAQDKLVDSFVGRLGQPGSSN